MDVLAILKQKSRPVYTVTINQTVDDAINLMAAKNVRALIVTDKGQPVSIFAERDVFRCYVRDRKCAFSDIKLKRAMTRRLFSAETTDEIPDLITMMIQSDLEHLPVIADNEIIGVLALIDLIEYQIESFTKEIRQLEDYIDDLHEAGRD